MGRDGGDAWRRGSGELATTWTRRDLLKTGIFASAAVALPMHRMVSARGSLEDRMPAASLPVPFTRPFRQAPVARPDWSDATTDHYRIVMALTNVEILPGLRTPMYTYNGSFPGPTVKVRRGRRVRMRQVNNLPAANDTLRYTPATSVHLHGSASAPQYDGYASDTTNPGQYKDYYYPNNQPGRTLWYHDHGVHHTAHNVYQGLAAQYHLIDPAEAPLELPSGEFDVGLTVSDATFSRTGALLFDRSDESGAWGDVILVNGVPWPLMRVQRRRYRFRFLNACISRSFRLSLSTGDPFTMVATDGGLMPAPQVVRSFRQGSGERYEAIIDFSTYRPGQRIVLRNTSPKNNRDDTHTNKIMAFEVTDAPVDTSDPSARGPVPSVLALDNATMELRADEAIAKRTMVLQRENSRWTINGTTWEQVIRSGFTKVEGSPVQDSVEMWTLSNPSGGWNHPFHIHLIDFKVISRNGNRPFAYERGPKDTVYLGENETVRVLARFQGVPGKYMVHCHNLVHEDHDMMSQFEVVAPGTPSADPLGHRCKDLPDDDWRP